MRFFSQIYDYMFAPAGTFVSGVGACNAHGLDDVSSAMQMPVTNPATGLPMISGPGGVDVMGNPFGFDLHDGTNSHHQIEPGIQYDGFAQCHDVPDMFADQYCGHDSTGVFDSYTCDHHSGFED